MKKVNLLRAVSLIVLIFSLGVLVARRIFPQGYSSYVSLYCEEFSLEPAQVYAVIWTESKFRPEALSPAGARGLMQLMPLTAEFCARGTGETLKGGDIYDPRKNIRLGCYYLAYLKTQFEGDYVYAAYNAGENKVRQWLTEGGAIGYKETAEYVKRVKTALKMYRLLY